MTIAIVGLGYVGLPLALQFARNGVTVVGLDVDPAKVSAVNGGRSYIKHIEAAAIAEQVSAGRLRASNDFSLVGEVEAVIICVPTPLNKNREPDISYHALPGKAIAPHLQRGIRGRAGIDDVSGHDRHGSAGGARSGIGAQSGRRFSSGVLARARRPGQPQEQGRRDSQGGRRLHAGLSRQGGRALRPRHQDPRAGFVLPRRRSHQAAREHFPRREHRPGQRT